MTVVFNFFYLRLYSPIQALAASMKLSVSLQLLHLGQSVGLLGRVISSSPGLYPYTNTEKLTHNTNTKHSCPECDWNPQSGRPQERKQFMPWTGRLPWPAQLWLITSHKSLIQIWKSRGPKTDPWGTPGSMKKGNESISEKRTKDCLLFK
jgi:hypothetical protein